MHLVVTTAFQYPDGGPAAARHLTLAAGLVAAGHRVSFVLLNQTTLPGPAVGQSPIGWVSVNSKGVRSGLRWRLAVAGRLATALRSVAAIAPVDAALLVDRDPVLLELGLRSARRCSIPALHEITEYPDIEGSAGLAGRLRQFLFAQRHLPALDGILVISRALHDHVTERVATPALLLGAMVDVESLRPFPPIELTTTLVVGYAGSLSERKDGVLTLLKAMAVVVSELEPTMQVRLEILGGDLGSEVGRAALRERDLLGLQHRVSFRGQVPHHQVRRHLSSCHVLVLPRPASRQASGGFPTKLGEYLSTGRPVLTTAVGEIPRYLCDGETCVMAAPNDVEELAAAFLRIVHDYPEAQAVGTRGREIARRFFDSTAQAAKVVSFVDELRGIAK